MYIQRAIPRFAQCARQPLSRRGMQTACFSIHGNEDSWQGTLVKKVTRTVRAFESKGLKKVDGSVVVLASRQYASWLLDDKFMAALLRPFGDSKSDLEVGREVTALAGVVDGLHPLRAFGDIPRGFSFYYGPEHMIMPSLWQKNHSDAQSAPSSNAKLNAAITFSYGRKPDNYVCTLPLANTIFQNGLQSTLIASRWYLNKKGGLDLIEREERRAQEVNIFTNRESETSNLIQASLVPITAPRKIVSGLGNIIRQVEVDGKETPASAELETAVQALFDRRTAEGHEFPPGPVGVWGLVCPPGDDQAGNIEFLNKWSGWASKIQNAGDEWRLALDMKDYLKWLIKRGVRVYKIQSGGGGWGKKAGLLSLDPEVKYSASSEEEDLDSFIRSFENRNEGGGVDAEQGVIAPGSYIQYFVVPPFTAAKVHAVVEKESQFTDCFGMTDDARLEASALVPVSKAWQSIRHQFGAVTTHGLFIECRSEPPLVRETKLDVPGAWIGHLGFSDQKRSNFRKLSLETEGGLGTKV
ncbi:hypothetical protein CSAL01_08464 [Colletotrichum salicis]|uniref:Uncharacterized protein n=1 Tax=Colletotrichum salicis TaxID=1209931 RepID=A0A135TGQ9_9PEZI|nr:hypothetical protein CSAL01_08464 [Colletotrichum salicis]